MSMNDDIDDDFSPWSDDPFDDSGETIHASEVEVTPVGYRCASCGEPNQTLLDLSGGYHQQYTEDCAVCCRPNLIEITVDPKTLAVTITNELEYE
jgi:hypothetical protein